MQNCQSKTTAGAWEGWAYRKSNFKGVCIYTDNAIDTGNEKRETKLKRTRIPNMYVEMLKERGSANSEFATNGSPT